MTKDKLRKADNSKTFCYEFYINSWSIDVEFNRYASVFSYESDHEYEESFSVVLDGHLVYTSATNKKMIPIQINNLNVFARFRKIKVNNQNSENFLVVKFLLTKMRIINNVSKT